MSLINFPDEVLLNILSNPGTFTSFDLSRISLSCKYLSNITLPILYQSIEFYFPLIIDEAETNVDYKLSKEIVLVDLCTLLETLEVHPVRASWIRHLCITWYNTQVDVRNKVFALLKQTSELQSLKLFERVASFGLNGLEAAQGSQLPLPEFLIQKCQLSNLTELQLDGFGSKADGIAPLFNLPKLRRARVYGLGACTDNFPTDLPASNIENLEFVKCLVPYTHSMTSTRNNFLGNHPRLTKLTYIFGWGNSKQSIHDFSSHLLNMSILQQNLTELYLSNRPCFPENYGLAVIDFSALKRLRVLRTHSLFLCSPLSINTATAGNTTGSFYRYCTDNTISERLPRSLKELDILFELGRRNASNPDAPEGPAYYEWSLNLVNSKPKDLPNLKRFRITEREKIGETEEFSTADAEEATARRFYPDEVKKACLTKGIFLEARCISDQDPDFLPQNKA